MPWIPRGLRDGVVTTRYPRRPDGYGDGFHGAVEVHHAAVSSDDTTLLASCPTGALGVLNGGLTLDRGACVLCGRCVRLRPQLLRFVDDTETARQSRSMLVVPERGEGDDEQALRRELAARVAALRRSVHVRHVDAGSDGSDEWEVAALNNPVYDVQRLGIFFTASPRHADVLLVTGAGSTGMMGPLRDTLDAMPHPRAVVAAGVDAISGGLLGSGYATTGGVTSQIPVDVVVPGSPATPFGLLYGLLLATNKLVEARRPHGGRVEGTST